MGRQYLQNLRQLVNGRTDLSGALPLHEGYWAAVSRLSSHQQEEPREDHCP